MHQYSGLIGCRHWGAVRHVVVFVMQTTMGPMYKIYFKHPRELIFCRFIIDPTDISTFSLKISSRKVYVLSCLLQSNPSISPILGLEKKRRYSENGSIGSHITYKTLIWDLKMGGDIGRAAVLGGAVLRGTTVHSKANTRGTHFPLI